MVRRRASTCEGNELFAPVRKTRGPAPDEFGSDASWGEGEVSGVESREHDCWKRFDDNGPDCSGPLPLWKCRYLVAFMS